MMPEPVNPSGPAKHRLIWIGLAAILALIAIYGTVGVYARPVLDDYCLAAKVREVGVIGTVSFQYWNWSGNVIGLYYQVAGVAFELYAVWPLALMLLWIATFSWFLWECLSLANIPRNRPMVVLIAAVLTLSLFDITPNIGQTLYWLNGTANYGPTSAIYLMFLTLLLRVARFGAKRVHYIAAVVFVFTAVLGQITMVIYCVGLLVPMMILAYLYRSLPHRRDLMRVLSIALVSGAIGALIVVATPGNDVREASLASVGIMRSGIGEAILRTGWFSVAMVGMSLMLYGPLAHIAVFIIGYFAGCRFRPMALTHRSLPRWVRLAAPFAGLLAGLFIFYLGAFASTYTLGNPGPPRAWVAPQSLWIILVLFTGYVYGLTIEPSNRLAQRRLDIALAVCITGFILLELVHLINFLPDYRNFAADHDARIALIEQAVSKGQISVKVPQYRTPVSELMMLNDGDELLCLRVYYGLDVTTMKAND